MSLYGFENLTSNNTYYEVNEFIIFIYLFVKQYSKHRLNVCVRWKSNNAIDAIKNEIVPIEV